MFDVKIRIIQRKAVFTIAVERNSAGVFVIVALILPCGHNDERMLTLFFAGIGCKPVVDFLQTRAVPAAVLIEFMWVFATEEDNVDVAVFRTLQPERVIAEPIANHLFAVVLLQVQQQFADATFVVGRWFHIIPDKIDDVEVVGVFFQFYAVCQQFFGFRLEVLRRSSLCRHGKCCGAYHCYQCALVHTNNILTDSAHLSILNFRPFSG